ncbi:MAG: glucosidase [Opitutae bacterium]|nr:glucosidase [Opitutae bacterium]
MPRVTQAHHTAEHARLAEDARRHKNWKRWGPYLAERHWGTVREDYSAEGEAWTYFPFEQAASRAYRWGEDGLLGITDRECRLCFAIALWNGRDPILKERLFGLSGPEGNHGEDVKEAYFYSAATPTHSHLRAVYHYPQAEFPYERLREENARRDRSQPEFELTDAGAFAENRFFEITVEYAKAGPNDILIEITATNRGPEPAPLHVLPTLWYRNTWSWGCTHEGCTLKPRIQPVGMDRLVTHHETLGRYFFDIERQPGGYPPFLFTENETNARKLFSSENPSPFVKDAFHEYVVHQRPEVVNPKRTGTKAAALCRFELGPGESRVIRARLYAEDEAPKKVFGEDFATAVAERRREAEEFYAVVLPAGIPAEQRNVAKQAFAGLLWSKQFYHYAVQDWIEGDPAQPHPPAARRKGRNSDWPHLFNRDILSMPDKWEYPWFAAWDLAFHMIPMARIDPHFAKDQLNLLLREWYMHPNGQIPAYEWNFSDVNPPVHAWACWRVYKLTGARGGRDRLFLARVFQKLLVNFTWWVNRKDPNGRHLFAGGFLGLDNIGVFDRSKPLPTGGHLEQADGTAWMAFYCSTMLAMALELAEHDPTYEDIASKFFEHFVAIADAMNRLGGTGLWHEEDGFYYDQLMLDGGTFPLRLRSLVGIIPLFAVEFIEESRLDQLPGFAKRTRWFLENRKDLAAHISYMARGGHAGRQLLAIPSRDRLARMLRYVFDEKEFLSPYGVRSLSRIYGEAPFTIEAGGEHYQVNYVPGESDSWLFGGNSNWRGPVWLPMNFLLIEALERYHHFYGDTFLVEFPTGSGRRITLQAAAEELAQRLIKLFLPGSNGDRPCHGPEWEYLRQLGQDGHVLFHEYFHGETGRGLGASHQTGWTALVARLIEDFSSDRAKK